MRDFLWITFSHYQRAMDALALRGCAWVVILRIGVLSIAG